MSEPFFTTRMGQGCPGLGLPRMHNLLKKALYGELTVHSTVQQGLYVELCCPVNLHPRLAACLPCRHDSLAIIQLAN